jgi:hypothetical protein
LKVYAGHPVSALTLAYQLIAISNLDSAGAKEYRTPSPLWIWRLTVFSAHGLPQDGPQPQQEEKLRQLGVKV